jgi:hypothetical protein
MAPGWENYGQTETLAIVIDPDTSEDDEDDEEGEDE